MEVNILSLVFAMMFAGLIIANPWFVTIVVVAMVISLAFDIRPTIVRYSMKESV